MILKNVRSYYLTVALLLSVATLTGFAKPAEAQGIDNVYLSAQDQCDVYFTRYERKQALPSRILKAIATQESGRWNATYKRHQAWPWTINVQGKGFYFPTKAKAVAEVRRLQAQGIESIDVGCMQVNLRYHPDAFNDLEAAFDPATNVSYAAKLLRTQYERFSSWKRAVAAYHSGGADSPAAQLRGRDYASRVLRYWRKEIDAMVGRPVNVASEKVAAKQRRAAFAPESVPTPVRKLTVASTEVPRPSAHVALD
jgi:hypothetical protein